MNRNLAEEILRRFREGGDAPVSGQSVARSLGITRAAVWKAIQGLRAEGYRVESVPARGYRLAPGFRSLRPTEIAACLETRILGRAVRHLESADSTNRVADRWAAEGAPEGALVVAEHQVAGRGRQGRIWHGLPRKSLLLSVILRPPTAPADAPHLTYAAAVALAEALSRWVPRGFLEIKWPNDVLIAGRKVAGILLEMRCEGNRVEHVILGVGVNVEGEPREFPADVRALCTTVAAHAPRAPDRVAVLCAFLGAFEEVYGEFLEHGFPALRERWSHWFRMAGTRLRVVTPSGVLEGKALGLGSHGELLLEVGAGEPARILAGDLERCTGEGT